MLGFPVTQTGSTRVPVSGFLSFCRSSQLVTSLLSFFLSSPHHFASFRPPLRPSHPTVVNRCSFPSLPPTFSLSPHRPSRARHHSNFLGRVSSQPSPAQALSMAAYCRQGKSQTPWHTLQGPPNLGLTVSPNFPTPGPYSKPLFWPLASSSIESPLAATNPPLLLTFFPVPVPFLARKPFLCFEDRSSLTSSERLSLTALWSGRAHPARSSPIFLRRLVP